MKKLFVISILAMGLSACSAARENRDINGAVIGGVGGTIIGGVASGTVGGAIVGGVVGAAGGALIADATRHRHYRHCYYSNRRGRTICR